MEILPLEQYIQKYYEKVTAGNARQVIDEFDEEWKQFMDYMIDETSEHLSKYGLALTILSAGYYEMSNANEKDIARLSGLIDEFDANGNVKYKFGIKQTLFLNLGLCWHKIDYDNRAVDAFKKYIYYLITVSSNTAYSPTAYAFRKCTNFLYQSLVNEQLNLSSPAAFNDPFDCPIRVLLDNDDDISNLQLQAYKSLKIACFTRNIKLPYLKEAGNWNSEPVYDEKKHRKDKKEFLNALMWAHYADSHKGICIKYRFHNSMTRLGDNEDGIVAYFKDVKYSNGDMSKYSKKDSINLEDAFFLKGKDWEYENELRFLYYDMNNQDTYGTIDIPNCIEAIYFGLKCSEKDKETIRNIMSLKHFVQRDLNGIVTTKRPVEFYQMVLDKKHFGQLKAVRLK
ncbi:MAG: DUF2971 domain-containing protein [Paramuribaculum sp.]|nr:DUF2971 domain-containing protein [Paramuribaculum sp.]